MNPSLKMIKGLTLPLVLATMLPLPLAKGAEFHVSPTGVEGNPGSRDKPFATLATARDAVRAARKLNPDEACQVILLDGIHQLGSSLVLSKEDSGKVEAPVVYRAANPGKARVYGGIELDAEAFKPCSDPEILKRLSPEARGRVLSYPLAEKHPGVAVPAVPKSYRGIVTLPYLYADGNAQTLARWPNTGWATFTKVLDNGISPEDPTNPSAKRDVHPGAFQFDDSRLAKWRIADGVWLFGYWTHDWYEEVLKIDSYDARSNAIRLAAAHTYGLGGKTFGVSKARRFYAVNLLEELDAPGEWYIGRKQLLYYPPQNGMPKVMVLSCLNQPLVNAHEASNIIFAGIEFSHSKGNGLVFTEVANVSVRDCRFTAIGKTAVTFKGAKACTVLDSEICEVGAGGISMDGGDRKNLVNANNRIENCHIHHFGQFTRTYAAAVNIGGCGNVMRNCRIHDAPHMAIGFSGNEHLFEYNDISRVLQETADAGAFYTGRDWTNQGNVIRYNYIHDLGAGGLGQSGTIAGVYLDDCMSGITVRGNILCRAGRGILIGGGRDNIIEGNLIVDGIIGIAFDARGMVWKEWNRPGKGWNFEEKAEAFNYKNPPWSTRYPKLAATMGNSPKEPLGTTFRNNLIVNAKQTPFLLAARAGEILPKLPVQGNVVALTSGNKTGAALKQAYKGFENRTLPAGWQLPENERGVPQPAKCSELLKLMPGLKEIPADRIGEMKSRSIP